MTELVREGLQAFYALVDAWKVGFDDPEFPQDQQPDRLHLVGQAGVEHGGAILAFVRATGGLRAATRHVLVGHPVPKGAAEENLPECKLADQIAGNIAQLAAIAQFPELGEALFKPRGK